MLSLYFHIPFCEKKCNYCSFFIIPWNKLPEFKKNYVENIIKEIKDKTDKFNLKKEKIYTIYFWGWTPSELEINNYYKLLEFLNNFYDLSTLEEFSLELNPFLSWKKSIIPFIKNLSSFISKKINNKTKIRFSIGIQSLNDYILKSSNRNYSFYEIIKVIDNLPKEQFISYNLDFISFWLETNKDFDIFKNFVKNYEKLIDSYSVYTLELFPGSIWLDKFKTNEEKILDNFSKYKKIITNFWYKRYEISNFSKTWLESKHNMVYWTMKPYLGIWPSASWFINNIRYTNSYSIKDYFSENFTYKEFKKLSNKEFWQEYIFLWLRLPKWIKLNKKVEKLINFIKLKELEKLDLIKLTNNNLHITEKWFDVFNYILSDILQI